jgi:hypothetical protein
LFHAYTEQGVNPFRVVPRIGGWQWSGCSGVHERITEVMEQ